MRKILERLDMHQEGLSSIVAVQIGYKKLVNFAILSDCACHRDVKKFA